MIEWTECWYSIWLTWQSNYREFIAMFWSRLLIISHQMDYLGPQLNNPASFDQSDYIPTDENFNICLNLYLNHFIMLIISQWIAQKLVLKKEIWMNDPSPASPKPTTHHAPKECLRELPRPASCILRTGQAYLYICSLIPVIRRIFPQPSWLHYSFIMLKGHKEKKQKTKGG